MKKRHLPLLALCALGASTALSSGAFAAEITLACQDVGFGCTAMAPVIKRFEAANPDITVKVENVPYQSLVESLPVQLESGQGPDMAVVTDLGGLSRFYLDLRPYVDAARFEAEYPQTLSWLRGADPTGKAINGMPTTLTVNGAYVNLSLFDQAGVPVPKEGATWADWAEATRKVAKATNTEYAMEMDRSGHRFASLAISYGAELVDDKGQPVVDEGLKKAIEQFVAWHKDGTMPLDLWGAVGGATHRELFADFLNAKTVLYFGGSWTLNKMDKEVGDLFDWEVAPAPCGPGSCTVMPGGGALVGFKQTKSPEAVGKLIEFMSLPENNAEMVVAAVEIPASKSLIDKGLDYPNASERTRESLKTFAAQVPKMAPAAFRFQGWRYQRAMMNAMTTRISQVINGELDVDTALSRIKQDTEMALQAAAK